VAEDRRTVTALIAPPRGSKRWTICLDTEHWRHVAAPVLRALDLAVGDEVDVSDLEHRLREVEETHARERALRLIAYRERSTAEVTTRLRQDGYPAELVEVLVDDLRTSGFLDDERLAEARVRSLGVRQGMGRARVRRDLGRLGVDDAITTRVIEEQLPAEDDRERAVTAARSAARRGDTPERLASRLVRRGFGSADAIRAARIALADEDRDDGASADR
jgi:regulatory protein